MTIAPPTEAFGVPTGSRIGMLSTYPPKLCGLATFAAALEGEFLRAGHDVRMIAVEEPRPDSHPVAMRQRLINGHAESVRTTARTLSECDVAIIQHEYGIYGGRDGDEILEVLRLVTAPTIVVLHTVPLRPSPHQQEVLEAICECATHPVVMTHAAGQRKTF